MLANRRPIDMALDYARVGIPVFPCDPTTERGKAKRPLTPASKKGKKDGGLYAATTDEAQIRRWWQSHPDALIGMPCGKKTGVLVIDLDPRGDDTLDLVRARLTDNTGEIPSGRMSRTPSGGVHLWFRMPDVAIKNAAGNGKKDERFRGIDWRSDGGYIILPYSQRADGKVYEWLTAPDEKLPDCSAPMLDMLTYSGKFAKGPEKLPVDIGRHISIPGIENRKLRRYCEVSLENACRDILRVPRFSGANSNINTVAYGIGHLVGAGVLDRENVRSALAQACMQIGCPPDDKALKPGGTLDRAIDDGARIPKDLSSLDFANRAPREIREPVPEYGFDPETGEIIDETENGGVGADKAVRGGVFKDAPFRMLGHNKGTYYYMSRDTQQVFEWSAAQHTISNLFELAPKSWWLGKFTAENPDSAVAIPKEAHQNITSTMLIASRQAGYFVPNKVRGRGAWVDNGRIIINAGTYARVDGVEMRPGDIEGDYVYEGGVRVGYPETRPLRNAEAHKLREICDMLKFEKRAAGVLLCGWIISAPVCGALEWRSHIWLSGVKGSGKTTVTRLIVKAMVERAAICTGGMTTEAAIRQDVGNNAMPVVYDEAGNSNLAAQNRMDGIVELARSASSGESIKKGSRDNKVVTYQMYSSFCLSSVHIQLHEEQDWSRFSQLRLLKDDAPGNHERYARLLDMITETITPEYAAAMYARTVANLPALLKNVKVFTVAAAKKLGDMRMADQIGVLLAGAYMCNSTGVATKENADEFIAKYEWDEILPIGRLSDEEELLSHLMTSTLRYEVDGMARETTIGRACILMNEMNPQSPAPHERSIRNALGTYGIRVWEGYVSFVNQSNKLADLLKGTQWHSGWSNALKTLPNAKPEGSRKYAPGVAGRGVKIPMELVYGTREPGEDEE